MNNKLHFYRKNTRTRNSHSDFLKTAQRKNSTFMLKRKTT